MPLRLVVGLVALASLAPPAAAADVAAITAGDLRISKAWTRQAPPGARVGAGYLTVTNTGSEPDRLLGGAAAFAGRVEIHEMSVADGVMRMAPVTGGLVIPPGGTVELEPGGYHVMFVGVTDGPTMGETVPVTLTFRRAGDVTVEMPVAAIGATSPDGANDGGGHSDMSHGAGPKDDE